MSEKRRVSLSQAAATGQLDIESAIADAKAREQLGATPAQVARRDNLAATGSLRTTSTAGYAEQVSVWAAKQREKAKRKNAKPDNGPTPERLAKLAEPDDIRKHAPPVSDKDTRALTRAHTIVAPVDKYGPSWPEELERAARDIRNIFLIAESGYQRVTGSYDGMPGGVAGPRHGGVADHIRECQNMAEVIRAKFPACMREIHWFLTQTVIKPATGDAMKFEDAGALISPWKSDEAKKGIGFGLFYRSIEVLAPFLAEQRSLGFGRGVSSPEAARALNTEMRALAQVLREREARKQRKDR